MEVIAKVRYASCADFLEFGREKVFSLLGDANVVGEFPGRFIDTMYNAIMFLAGVVFLVFVSVGGSLIVLGLLAILGTIYYRQAEASKANFIIARELSDRYHKSVIDLLHGYREVKMSLAKSQNLFSHLDQNRKELKTLSVNSTIKWMLNNLYGKYIFYVLIGVVIFMLPNLFASSSRLVGPYVVTLFFLMPPLTNIIGSIPNFINMQISYQRLRDFDLKVDHSEMRYSSISAENTLFGDKSFESLDMQEVIYEYKKQSFSINVPKFSILKGEVVFITGGNGSGKTTFISILCGLLRPSSGSIRFNGCLIDRQDYQLYRNKLVVIFSDNYLFSENYDDSMISEDNAELNRYISLMKLQGIVTVDSRANKLLTELSRGQGKRLAMIYALLENKDVLVLDEWAADQDPQFRAYFYRVFLQKLRDMGKTVIVVTHDDAYFSCADRIVKFDQGTIVTDENKYRDGQTMSSKFS